MEEINFYSTVSLLEEDLIHSFLLENHLSSADYGTKDRSSNFVIY